MTTSESKGRFFLQNESIRIANCNALDTTGPTLTTRISGVARNLLMGGQAGGLEGGTPQRGPAAEPRWGGWKRSTQKLETNVHVDFENKPNTAVFLHNFSMLLPVC